jgi:hypothetical protein
MIEENDFREILSRVNTAKEMSMEIGCCVGTVKNYLKKFNIETPSGFYSSGLPSKRKPMSQEQKDLRSKKFKGKGNPFYGKKHTNKTKQQMSDNHADFTGDKNPFKNACKNNPELLQDVKDRKIEEWSCLDLEARYNRSKKTVYEDISKGYWSNVKSNANTRSIEFNITPEYAWSVFKNQGGLCNLTGIELNLKTIHEITASLDRIDSNKPYEEGNIQWLHKTVNIMKNQFSMKDFINICYMVVNNDIKKDE